MTRGRCGKRGERSRSTRRTWLPPGRRHARRRSRRIARGRSRQRRRGRERRRPPTQEERSMKVLVTGGAGYVGGVSVDAILAAGHDVVVLDDLSTGHAAIANPAARLVTGSYGDETATRDAPGGRGRRRDPPLRRPLAGRRERAGPGEVLPRQRGGWGGAPGGGPGGGRAARRLLVHRGRLRHPGLHADPRGRGPPPDQHLRRDQAHVRGGAPLVRRGVRAPERDPALLQRGGRHGAPGRGPPARDAPGPQRAAGRGRRTGADAVRRRLPHP